MMHGWAREWRRCRPSTSTAQIGALVHPTGAPPTFGKALSQVQALALLRRGLSQVTNVGKKLTQLRWFQETLPGAGLYKKSSRDMQMHTSQPVAVAGLLLPLASDDCQLCGCACPANGLLPSASVSARSGS